MESKEAFREKILDVLSAVFIAPLVFVLGSLYQSRIRKIQHKRDREINTRYLLGTSCFPDRKTRNLMLEGDNPFVLVYLVRYELRRKTRRAAWEKLKKLNLEGFSGGFGERGEDLWRNLLFQAMFSRDGQIANEAINLQEAIDLQQEMDGF